MTESLVRPRPDDRELADPPADSPNGPGAHGRSTPWRQPGVLLSAAVVAVLLAWAVVPSAFTSHDPVTGVPAQRFRPPGPEHLFGTDALGRDLLTRVIHGTSTSLTAVAIAVLVAFVLGTALGLLSASVGGVVDEIVMRIVDVMLAVPGLLVSLLIVSALGFGMVNVALAVGISAVATFARVMRSEVLRIRHADFVEAASACGVGRFTVVRRHVLPNAIGPILALSTLEFGTAVLSISALSFLGFGATPPTPEWGALVADGRGYIATAWWLSTLPGLVILLTVLAVNRIGHAARRP